MDIPCRLNEHGRLQTGRKLGTRRWVGLRGSELATMPTLDRKKKINSKFVIVENLKELI